MQLVTHAQQRHRTQKIIQNTSKQTNEQTNKQTKLVIIAFFRLRVIQASPHRQLVKGLQTTTLSHLGLKLMNNK